MTYALDMEVGRMTAADGKFDTDKDYLTMRDSGYGIAGGVTWFFTNHNNHPGARYSVNGYVMYKQANTQPTGNAEVVLAEGASSRVLPFNQRGITIQDNNILITRSDGTVVLDTNEKMFVITDTITGNVTPPTRSLGSNGVQNISLGSVTPGSNFVIGNLTFTHPSTGIKKYMNAGGTFISTWYKNSIYAGPSVNGIRALTFMVVSNQLVMRDNYNNGNSSGSIYGNMVGQNITYNIHVGRFV